MRPLRSFPLALALCLPPAALCACDGGGDDGGADTDALAACQALCDAEYADEVEGCDACDVTSTLEDGLCSCQFLACVQELCVAFCEEHDAGAASALCYLDACTCG